MPRTRTAEKRRVILDAASRAFSRREFHKVRVEEIATSAGIGKGTIFRYFPTKEDLYLAAILQGFSDLHQVLASAADEEDSPASRLDRIASEILLFFWNHRCFYSLLHRNEQRFRAAEPRIRQDRDKIVELVQRILADGVARGQIRCRDPKSAAEMFLGMLRAVNIFRRDSDRLPDARREVMSIFLHGVESGDRA